MTDQQQTGALPTLTTVDEAVATLRELAETNEWVSVFWDRGWGDSGQPAEISIVVNGNGQGPKARITGEVYRALLDQKIIRPNSLTTYKARRLHDYVTPPPPATPTVSPTLVATEACRKVMDTLPDVPVVMQTGIYPNYTYARTPAGRARIADQWSVRLSLGHSDVAVAGSGQMLFGANDCIGETVSLVYRDFDGGVTGAAFAAALTDAIRAKASEVAAST